MEFGETYGALLVGYLFRGGVEAFSGNGLYCIREGPGTGKYWTVKEVCALTGLTGKHLYYFHHENVVRATAYANYSVEGNDGYKLYDKQAVEKLQHIALYYQLGLKRNEIRDLMRAPDYDSNAVLEQLLERTRERQKALEKQILGLEYIRLTGTKNGLAGLPGEADLEGLGEALKEAIGLPFQLPATQAGEASRLLSSGAYEQLFGTDNTPVFWYALGLSLCALGEGTAAGEIPADRGKAALCWLSQHPDILRRHLPEEAPEE